MKKFCVRLITVICALCVLLSLPFSAGALTYQNDVKTQSKSIILVNMDMDQVVYEKAADEKRYPASTTKIMTYIVAFENIEDIYNTRVEIKQSVIDQLIGTGSSMSSIEDHVGDKIKVIDLFYSMMVPSGNDAAMVLADYVGGGDIDRFVEMMNKKAEELGCENTHFMNPDGLHDPQHYTTARDMYKIAKYALTLDPFREITDTTSYTVEGDEYPIVTTNLMIDVYRGGEYYYMYAHGIKTGTTDEAGRCLVTSATADGNSYLAVLLGAPYKEGEIEEYYTFEDAAALFRWALVQLEQRTVKTTETPICEAKVKLAWGKDKVTLVPERNLYAILPSGTQEKEILVEADVPEVLEAPLSPEEPVGTASVYYQSEKGGEKQKIATVNLVPEEQIDRSGILAVLDVIGTIFRSYWFIVLIGIIILILLIYLIAARIHRKRVRERRRVKRYRNF